MDKRNHTETDGDDRLTHAITVSVIALIIFRQQIGQSYVLVGNFNCTNITSEKNINVKTLSI